MLLQLGFTVSLNTRCEQNGSLSTVKGNNWLTSQSLNTDSLLELFWLGWVGFLGWLVLSFYVVLRCAH